MRRHEVIGKLLPLALVALLTGCQSVAQAQTTQNQPQAQTDQKKPQGQRQLAVPVSEQTAQRGPIASELTYSGNVSSRASVNVLPRATGRIDQLNVDVGTPVKAGDTIAVLDQTQLKAQVDQAQGAL